CELRADSGGSELLGLRYTIWPLHGRRWHSEYSPESRPLDPIWRPKPIRDLVGESHLFRCSFKYGPGVLQPDSHRRHRRISFATDWPSILGCSGRAYSDHLDWQWCHY